MPAALAGSEGCEQAGRLQRRVRRDAAGSRQRDTEVHRGRQRRAHRTRLGEEERDIKSREQSKRERTYGTWGH